MKEDPCNYHKKKTKQLLRGCRMYVVKETTTVTTTDLVDPKGETKKKEKKSRQTAAKVFE